MWVDGSTQALLNSYREEDLLNISLPQQESQWYIFLGSQLFESECTFGILRMYDCKFSQHSCHGRRGQSQSTCISANKPLDYNLFYSIFLGMPLYRRTALCKLGCDPEEKLWPFRIVTLYRWNFF